MSIQLALRFDDTPITCETRAAVSFDFPLPGREAIGGRTGGRARSLIQHCLPFFYLYLAGELVGDTPQELLETAIQGAACNRKSDDLRKDKGDDEARMDE
jgi:hypothetical protein